MPDLPALVQLASRTAEEAGALLLGGMGDVRTSVETKSTRTDMVTEMDRASERLITDRLLAARPDDAVLGEEGTADAGTSGVRWVVDPLDGTTNYLYGFPSWAVSIAGEVDGEAAVAAVHDPVHRETFTAVRGQGAWRNGQPIRASGVTELATALVGTGFSYDASDRARQSRELALVLPAVRDVRRAGAAALDLCWVGLGRLDAFYERGLQPWDFAGGALVAREAGALTDRLPDGTVIAAPPALFAPLRDLLVAAIRSPA